MTLDLFPNPLPPHARHDQIGRPKRKPTRTRRGMYIRGAKVSELQVRILRVLAMSSGLTHDEIRRRVNEMYRASYSQNNVRSRCSELHRQEPGDDFTWLIMPNGFRACGVTGEQKNTWKITPLGRDGLERMRNDNG